MLAALHTEPAAANEPSEKESSLLPGGYEKKSFRRFNVAIDTERLISEYRSIPADAWMSSYWGDIHCSIGMLLLRGGRLGSSEDFFSDSVTDAPVLERLPYIKHLMAKDGPFGGAVYGSLFRMEADGVTLKHRDLMEQWRDLYRVHIPILTNHDAYLISSNRSMHFAAGSAWSFDNFKDHGVVNGGEERTHLILDVAFNETMKNRIDEAEYIRGKEDIEHIKRIANQSSKKHSYPGDPYITDAIKRLRERQLSDAAIADFFNEKKIPTRAYNTNQWRAQMITNHLNQSFG